MLARSALALSSALASRGGVALGPAAAVAAQRAPMFASSTIPALALRGSQLRMQGMGLSTDGGGPDRTVVDKCTDKIKAALPGLKEIEVKGSYDDPNGSHVTIYCVADEFEGKRSLGRQQMVFKAIWEEMQGPVHAVDTMVLKAPSEL